MQKRSYLFVFALILLKASQVVAQQTPADTVKTNDLAPVTVTAYRMELSDIATPLSMTRIGQKQLQTGTQQLSLDETLMNVPGVFVQNGSNFAQDIRVSIRGFGARSAFGIRGVKVLVDGFPESTPDGTSQVDAIDPGALTGLTVIRSGTGGLYGNASGGSINFSTLRFNDEEWGEAGTSIGSYGFQKSQLKFGGGKANKFLYSMNGAFTSSDGYRKHSAMKNYLGNGGFLWNVDSTLSIKGVITYVNSPYAQDPGGLEEEEVEEDRKQANEDNLFFETGENLWQLRTGLGLTKYFSNQHRIQTSIFQTNRSFESLLVIDAVHIQRSFTGGNANYEYRTKPGLLNWRLQLGTDIEQQTDDRKRFDNNNNGILGDQYAYTTESFSSAGFYTIQQLDLNEQILLLSSLRYDRIFVNVDDKFPGNNNADDRKDDFSALNPTLGVSVTLVPTVSVFFNYGQNFEAPTLLELSQSDANGLEPQTSKSFELGYKILTTSHKFRLDLSLFKMQLKNEIIQTTDGTGNRAYRNVGKSSRLGIEASVAAQMGKSFSFSLSTHYYEFVLDEYDDFDGKKMPGIPRTMTNFMVNYTGIKRLSLSFGTNYVSSIFTEFENKNQAAEYIYGYLRAAYRFKLKANELEWSGGINNLYKDYYNANIRINSFSTTYEPAPLRNFYTGIKIRF